ncbi:MAG: hypothetical protein ACRBFS_04870 [Aureispira sp.]
MQPITAVVLFFFLFITVGKAQIQHQIGFEAGVSLNKINYSVAPDARFVQAPDLSSEFSPGLMATLKYDLILLKQLHIGLGLGLEEKRSSNEEVETTNLLLPLEVGYRSPLIGKMYLTGDLLFMPHLVVRNLRTFYDTNQEVFHVSEPHRPLNIQLGIKAGAGWALTDRLALQINLLGKIDGFKYAPKDAVVHERSWGIQLNAGLRWTL